MQQHSISFIDIWSPKSLFIEQVINCKNSHQNIDWRYEEEIKLNCCKMKLIKLGLK